MMSLYACGNCGTVRTDDEQCRVCGFERFEAVDLAEDETVVEEELEEDEQYECDDCDRSFDTKRGLANHQRVHDDE